MGYLFYFILYTGINYFTEFSFSYSDVYELLWGTLLITLFSEIISGVIFRCAWSFTGFWGRILSLDSTQKRTVHWKIRALLAVLVLLFSITPLCSMLLTPVVDSSYIAVKGYLLNIYNHFVESIQNSLLSLRH